MGHTSALGRSRLERGVRSIRAVGHPLRQHSAPRSAAGFNAPSQTAPAVGYDVRAVESPKPALLSVQELAETRPWPLVVQVTSSQTYAAVHLPGALHVAPGELVGGVPPAIGALPSAECLTALFRRIGFNPACEREVVVLDDEGGGWAGRFAWTLDVIGHTGWRYLDGGLHAWHDAGLPLVATPTRVRPSDVEVGIRSGPIADAEELLARLGDPDLLVWDCRSAEEYAGTRESSARAGHIPGAVNLDWLALVDRHRGCRLVENLPSFLAERGIDAERDVVTHCQTHHRSGLAYMAARLAGFARIRAYPGSWAEWGNRADTPVETGAARRQPS